MSNATGLNYYSYNKILSFNAFYNMIIGPRGDGKTFGAKKHAITKAIKKGEMFIYLRRYKEEMQVSSREFFNDIESFFPDWDFKVGGTAAYMAPASTRKEKKREWTQIGYFIALSRAQQYKSVSYEKVTTIIFDEFIIEKGAVQYLPNETTVVNNFYNTVDRYKEKTRLFMISNAVRATNPHFIEYKIDPDKADEKGFLKYFIPDRDNPFMVVHFIDDEQFINDVKNTAFGQFISGTDYESYAVGNQFSDNHQGLISEKTPNSRYRLTLETKNGTFSIWIDPDDGMYYAQSKRPGNEKIYTLIHDKMAEDKTLAEFSDKLLGGLRTAYRHARMRFDKPSTRNAFVEIFKR
jgi:hypothetical protein